MANTRNKSTEAAPDAAAQQASDEVQAKVDEAEAQGYIGTVPDPNPNSAYSIATGPESPPIVDNDRTRFDQPAAPPGPGAKEG